MYLEDLEFIKGPFKIIRLFICSITGGHKMRRTTTEQFGDHEYRHSKCRKCGYRNYTAK